MSRLQNNTCKFCIFNSKIALNFTKLTVLYAHFLNVRRRFWSFSSCTSFIL